MVDAIRCSAPYRASATRTATSQGRTPSSLRMRGPSATDVPRSTTLGGTGERKEGSTPVARRVGGARGRHTRRRRPGWTAPRRRRRHSRRRQTASAHMRAGEATAIAAEGSARRPRRRCGGEGVARGSGVQIGGGVDTSAGGAITRFDRDSSDKSSPTSAISEAADHRSHALPVVRQHLSPEPDWR